MTNVASILDQLTDDEREVIEAAIKTRRSGGRSLSMRVSKKGAVSVYGVHSRFPVTLYANQWERLLAFGGEIQDFLASSPTFTHEIDGVETEVSLSIKE